MIPSICSLSNQFPQKFQGYAAIHPVEMRIMNSTSTIHPQYREVLEMERYGPRTRTRRVSHGEEIREG